MAHWIQQLWLRLTGAKYQIRHYTFTRETWEVWEYTGLTFGWCYTKTFTAEADAKDFIAERQRIDRELKQQQRAFARALKPKITFFK